ncbi:rhodanese-like domain-containing protein 4A, chloroplastic isoform X1 [Amborella trichopoda]|uniref:rhodanese-like domain-containing protein 4A, chloroplastic isoform X1 n=1 Tax=Amborella trichopoda TaxID=13333 RepID=UPI0005D43C6F|nr:rhodanese-like domain-containing protein 4A, chloroplastic isoform X1 [Amborella trichopoda]|eukprot:XP_006858740.2 rhodanese-like domain-containing protein 4A, chloroplastic isoform X1 [Amborella trichopoda]
MDSIPLSLSSLSPLQTHSDPQMRPPKTTFPLLNRFLAPKTAVLQIHLPISKTSSHLQNFHTTQKTIFSPFQSQISTPKTTVHLKNPHPSTHFSIPKTTFHLLGSMAAAPLPTYAETLQFSDKIDIEKTLIAIDDFFNRYPFFVASVTFIWLVVIPVTQELLKKYKSIATIDAFRKLRDDPSFILLDIRPAKSVLAIGSPNLKTLKKTCVNVEYREGEDEDFVKKVMEELSDPPNTTVCVLDNFDGNSMKVAKLLVENGFKEAYAIKGGIMGKDGWQVSFHSK